MMNPFQPKFHLYADTASVGGRLGRHMHFPVEKNATTENCEEALAALARVTHSHHYSLHLEEMPDGRFALTLNPGQSWEFKSLENRHRLSNFMQLLSDYAPDAAKPTKEFTSLHPSLVFANKESLIEATNMFAENVRDKSKLAQIIDKQDSWLR